MTLPAQVRPDDLLLALPRPACLTDDAAVILAANPAFKARVPAPPTGRFLLDTLNFSGAARRRAQAGWEAARERGEPLVTAFAPPAGWCARWEAGPLGGGVWLHTFEEAREETGTLAALLAEAFDQAPIGFALFDADGRYLRVNDTLAGMNGLPAGAHVGRTVGELLPGLPAEVTRRLGDTLRQGTRGSPVEVLGQTPATPGEPRAWLVDQYPLHGPDGGVVGAAGLAIDITERRRAELALRTQARTLREQTELLALANETVIVRDPVSRVVEWNPAAEALYGYAAGEARGQVTHSLLRTRFPESREAVDRALFGAGFWEGELTHLRRGGEEIVVLSRQAVQRDERGRVRAILEVNWDITARKRAEQRLEDLNRTLERRVAERTAELIATNEELEAFAYTVAHDLRAPLRSIGGFAHAVREDHAGTLDEEGQDMLRRIEHNAERLDRLIRDLLAYSHLGRTPLHLGPVRLDGVFGQVLGDLGPEIRARQASVEVASPLPAVLGDEITLRQVAFNLLGNALKFVAPGVRPEVRVWAEPCGERVRVWVEDNGIGVEARHEQRIFRVFERLHTLEEYPGTGVGLAIVKKGVERMNGRVGVRAGERGGSRFWFELPPGPGAA
ncbi:sensor histidine kinase [Deinococcus apachensis]|uniref:sensor histidine kinase n=1 Tax=Deinococcus apachensis TaxID=309886 RepID=UPI00036B6199|nr:PAS domain-containing protein [Deinococcus apachensis]